MYRNNFCLTKKWKYDAFSRNEEHTDYLFYFTQSFEEKIFKITCFFQTDTEMKKNKYSLYIVLKITSILYTVKII